MAVRNRSSACATVKRAVKNAPVTFCSTGRPRFSRSATIAAIVSGVAPNSAAVSATDCRTW